jgi:tetratricopeptide (TPR) repeat protein
MGGFINMLNLVEGKVSRFSALEAVFIMGILVIGVFAFYQPTVSGPFIFDDEANLQRLRVYSDLDLWERMLYFVTYGGQSLIERPLSYISFFINDHAWPSNPEGFRHTNISIHAINTLLAFWLVLKLLQAGYASLPVRRRLLLAGGVALLWALHPVQVNAVAYIIQRMTLLSGTFVLAGLLCYLTGRLALAEGKARKGYIWMSLAILVCMPLAFLSKQTGVLLPLYILVTEMALLQQLPGAQQARRWSYFFVGIPVAAVLLSLVLDARDKVFQWYDALPFGPVERLLTESRILWDYLSAIVVPRAHLSSLYHDNYPISHSLLDPPSTLLAVAALVAVSVGAVLLRRRIPLLFFAVFWFLAGHLLESSIIGLELYYEHRNYLPSFGILFAVLVGGYRLLKSRPGVYVTLATTYLILVIFVGYMNALKWRSEPDLIAAWYQDNPESIRTMKAMTGLLHAVGEDEKVREILVKGQKRWPKSAELPLMLLLLDCLEQRATAASVGDALNAIPIDYWHSNTLSELVKMLHDPIAKGQCSPVTLDDLEAIIRKLLRNPRAHAPDKSAKWGAVSRNLYYNLAEIGRDQRNLDKAITALDQGNEVWPTTDFLIVKTRWLVSAGLYQEALDAARQALELSREETLFPFLNPHEKMLVNEIAHLERFIRENPAKSTN